MRSDFKQVPRAGISAPLAKSPVALQDREIRNLGENVVRVAKWYSHLNGMEWLNHHYPEYWEEIVSAVESVDAEECKTKVSKEKTMMGRLLYSPVDMNQRIKEELHLRSWGNPERYDFFMTDCDIITKEMIDKKMDLSTQRDFLVSKGKILDRDFHRGTNEADFFKNGISIEVQFGKYAFVQYDIFIKHAADYMQGRINLGIEIVPMKKLERQMSSGPTNYERNLHEILRQGRIFPPVPLILVGIEP